MDNEPMTDKNLETHRNTLQGLVSSLEIPIDVLADRERAMAALMAILPKISRPVEQEHIEASRKS